MLFKWFTSYQTILKDSLFIFYHFRDTALIHFSFIIDKTIQTENDGHHRITYTLSRSEIRSNEGIQKWQKDNHIEIARFSLTMDRKGRVVGEPEPQTFLDLENQHVTPTMLLFPPDKSPVRPSPPLTWRERIGGWCRQLVQ